MDSCRRLLHAPIVAATLSIPTAGLAAAVEWPLLAGGNGHYYEVFAASAGISWESASVAATTAGGYLATIASAAENAFVFSLVASDPGLWYIDHGHGHGPWLGGFQPPGSPEPAGNWQWVNGEGMFTYTNWAMFEPNNDGGNEDAIHFFGFNSMIGATWNDVWPEISMLGYVVEYNSNPVPLPAGLWLLGSGVLLLLGRMDTRRS